MVRPYSSDLRERAIAAVEQEGMSRRGAAARFGLSESAVIKWVQRFRATGSTTPAKMGGHRPKTLSGSWREWMIERCTDDFTLRGVVRELAELGLKVDYRSVWEFVHAEGLSHKKRR